jgi:hypothetical protein
VDRKIIEQLKAALQPISPSERASYFETANKELLEAEAAKQEPEAEEHRERDKTPPGYIPRYKARPDWIERDSKYDRKGMIERCVHYSRQGWRTKQIIEQVLAEEEGLGHPVPPPRTLYKWFKSSTDYNP